MKKKELLEEVEHLKINNDNLCMEQITFEHRIEELEKENKQLKQDLRSIKTQLEIYFKNKSLRPVTKAEMLLDAFYQLLKNQYQD